MFREGNRTLKFNERKFERNKPDNKKMIKRNYMDRKQEKQTKTKIGRIKKLKKSNNTVWSGLFRSHFHSEKNLENPIQKLISLICCLVAYFIIPDRRSEYNSFVCVQINNFKGYLVDYIELVYFKYIRQ